MKNFILSLITISIFLILFTLGLKACDHEAQQNEINNLQWVEDANNDKPYTNYGAE